METAAVYERQLGSRERGACHDNDPVSSPSPLKLLKTRFRHGGRPEGARDRV